MLFLSNTIMSRVSIGEHSFSIYYSYQCANIAPARPAALTPSMNPHMQTYFSHIFSTIYAEVFSYCHGHFYPCWYCA